MNKKLPEPRVIKEMALQFSNFGRSFKASKGWYEKFMQRLNRKDLTSDKSPLKMIIEDQDKILNNDQDPNIYLSSDSEKLSIISEYLPN